MNIIETAFEAAERVQGFQPKPDQNGEPMAYGRFVEALVRAFRAYQGAETFQNR